MAQSNDPGDIRYFLLMFGAIRLGYKVLHIWCIL
jgi:hypothetical protein